MSHHARAPRRDESRRHRRRLTLEALEPRVLLSGSPLIAEFMAVNDATLADIDGDYSDWIEIYNPGPAAVGLLDWGLTDVQDDDDPWRLPDIQLGAGERLVVFASGKDRAAAGQELHTDFALDGAGEYLALIRADGVTVESEFAPFPEQREDVSYGLAPTMSATLVSSFAPATAFVPTDDALGTGWRDAGFDDTGWHSGATGVGYENGTGYEPLLDIKLLGEMFGLQTTAYIRIPFTVDNPADFDRLTLRMKYDDGFVAFLNGVRIAGRNDPASLTWNSSATQQNSDSNAVVFEDIDVSVYLGALQPGDNVLAIHGLNENPTSSDLLILPELAAASNDFDPENLRYFTAPTPGAANGDGVVGFLDTRFDIDRGFFDATFDVTILANAPDAAIRYTIDGTEPTQSHGTLYTGPIQITTTTVLRAIATRRDWLPSNVDTQTYLFLDDVLDQPASIPGFPSPNANTGKSQSVPLDYEMDPEVVGDPAYSASMMAAMASIPSISIVGDTDDIFDAWLNGGGSSSDIEHPISIEFLYPDDAGRNAQADAGVRPHSHRYVKRSLRIVFRSEYGDAKLDHGLFIDAPLYGDAATDEFDRLVLRAGGNRNFIHYWNPDDSTYTRDEWARASQIAMSGVGSHGTFMHLYVNGVYMGLYNPVERPDHFFQAAYYGGHQDDYFAINHGGVINGDATRWNTLKGTLKDKDMSVAANYAEMQQYLDVEQFADYILLNLYAGTDDWPTNNWYGGYYTGDVSGGEPGPMRFFVWDAEDIWDDEGSSGPFDQPGGRGSDGPWITPELQKSYNKNSSVGDIARIFHSLRDSDEFMLLFADRAYKHLFNGGALTDANSQARWQALNDYVFDAIIAESARWGDSRAVLPGESGMIRDRDGTWQSEVDRVYNESMPGAAVDMIQVLRNEGYYPSIGPAAFSQHGGTIDVGFQLSMANPNGGGTVYYTTDGTDPRLLGGGVSPDAQQYSGALTLNESTLVKARVRKDGEWSALAEATFLLDAVPALRVTEIMYNPAQPTPEEIALGFTENDDFEFIEVQNVGPTPIDLTEMRFTDGIDFVFGELMLGPGEHAIVAKNPLAFAQRYGGIPIAGDYGDSNLSNGGERLTLVGALGEAILDFEYSDNWYDITDGDGFSLVVIDATADPGTWGDQASWRPSAESGGSPGDSDSGVLPGSIVINEALTHTDGPVGDWIELWNTTPDPIDVGGWYLSDDGSDLLRYRIADETEIPGNGYLVFTQFDNFGVGSTDPGSLVGFGLTELGETVHLASATDDVLTGYRASGSFGAAEKEVTFGRTVKSTGNIDFVAMSAPTMGAANAAPKVGPVVINEIMYNPATGDEFIELRNLTDSPLPLYDPLHPENAWTFTDGVEFTFATGDEIPADGYALVVPIDPATFRATCGIPAAVPIFGPYTGVLDNGGEAVEIGKPGDPEPQGPVPIVLADRVKYGDELPWYPQADGLGSSLSRLDAAAYGNDVANWAPSTMGGTPGTANVTLDLTPPTVPGNVTATVVGATQIDLAWDASTDPETSVVGYRVYRNSALIGSPASPAFNDASAEAGRPYTYRIAAVNGDGIESARSTPLPVAIMAVESAKATDANHVHVAFSEDVERVSAEAVGSYAIAGVTVSAAALQADGRTVVLTTSTLTEGQPYVVTVSGVLGLAGGQLAPGAFAAFELSSRVDDGLVVLYELDEGAGTVVHDVSGVGAPLDLAIGNPAATMWIAGGLSIDSGTIVASAGAATKVIDAVTATHAITIETWVAPATTNQSGPARIVTLSANTGVRNFTLGQDLDDYDQRLRTTATTTNGIPAISTGGGALTTDLTHVVYTRAASGTATLYVDGAEAASGSIGGDLSNWDSSYRLGLANEFTMDRAWRGEIHLVAIYDRALTAAEVGQNYDAGANAAPPTLAIDDVAQTEGDSGTSTFAFTVTLSRPTTSTVTVHYATADGSATVADGDYQAASGALTFLPGGSLTQAIEVQVGGDTALEPDETFDVILDSPSGAALADGQGIGTLANDDIALPGQLLIGTEPIEGGRLSLTAPAARSLGILAVDTNGNPSSTLYAIQTGDDPYGGWLRFEETDGQTYALANGTEAEWHTAAEWAGKRLRDLEPGTSYAFSAKAKPEGGPEGPTVTVGIFSTSIDGDVNGSGISTALDYAYLRASLLRGGQVGIDIPWAVDINDSGAIDSMDAVKIRDLILNPATQPPSPHASAPPPEHVAAALALTTASVSRPPVLDRNGDGVVNRDDLTA